MEHFNSRTLVQIYYYHNPSGLKIRRMLQLYTYFLKLSCTYQFSGLINCTNNPKWQEALTSSLEVISFNFRTTSFEVSPYPVLKSNRSACLTLSRKDELSYEVAIVCQTPTTLYLFPEDAFPRRNLSPPFTSGSRAANSIRFLMPCISSSWEEWIK